MKRFLAWILVLSCVFALTACSIGGSTGGNALTTVANMYKNSEPTKTVVKSEQKFGDITLKGEQSLVKGEILYEGEWKTAAVYQWKEQQRAKVEEEIGPTKWVSGSLEYVDGLGVRQNKGRWTEGDDFTPGIGQMALNLDASALSNVNYNSSAKTLTFTVTAANLAKVFGEGTELTSDVFVTIVNDGAVITDVILDYSEEATEELPNGKQITIHTTYSYDNETVTLLK